mgnify:CR=1 FL=1
MLISNSFDAMSTITAKQERGALQGFGSGDLHAREFFLKVIAGGNGAGRARGRSESRQPGAGLFDGVEDLFDG